MEVFETEVFNFIEASEKSWEEKYFSGGAAASSSKNTIKAEPESMDIKESAKSETTKAEKPKAEKQSENSDEQKTQTEKAKSEKEPEKEPEKAKSEKKSEKDKSEKGKGKDKESLSEDDKMIKDLNEQVERRSRYHHELPQNVELAIDAYSESGLKRLVRTELDNSKEDSLKVGLFEHEIVSVPNRYYVYEKGSDEYKDLKSELLKYDVLSGKLLYSEPKEDIISSSDIENRRLYLNYIKQPIHRKLFPAHLYEQFIQPIAYFKNHMYVDLYEGKLKGEVGKFENINFKQYHIPHYPTYVNHLCRTINKTFDEIKDELVYNEVTGYYAWRDKKGKLWDIICRHDYMLKTKHSLENVLKECVSRGHCKYCGEELTESDFVDITGLPGQIRKFAFDLIEVFNGDISDTDLINSIGQHLGTFVIGRIQKNEPRFEDRANAICAALVYKIVTIGSEEKFIGTIDDDLIKSIQYHCGKVNWTLEKVKELINKPLFDFGYTIYDTIVSTVKSKLITSSNTELDEVATPLGKILSQRNDVESIYTMLQNVEFKEIKTQEVKCPKPVETKNCLTKFTPSLLTVSKQFINYITSNCPAKLVHDFKKDECIHCGYKKDGSNVYDLYVKYYTVYEMELPTKNTSKLEFKDIGTVREDAKAIIGKISNEIIQTRMCEILNVNVLKWNEIVKKSLSLKLTLANALAQYFNHENLLQLPMLDLFKLIYHLYQYNKNKDLPFILLSTSINFNVHTCSSLNDNDGEIDYE